ncbi:MAG: hypothetical protein CMF74_05455 [Maricaulis sp.]|jgi:uncharacterized small protein (DUF1192 family)|nr:hypothetical protein [Maricaulis sp.]HAQ36328.1 DUF1192 domain-containing protein [Alphaproteobacteria bacterium]|tara:strand:+ start:504 stop:701 length:198 start_codon:yes stop_codon:yes gene_type:complete
MFSDGDLPLRSTRTTITPGEDISGFSVSDLEERKALLQAEIERADAMIHTKTAGRQAAESVFRKS